MKTICLYFEIHQIIHLKRYRCFDIGTDHYYYDDYENERSITEIAERSYIPALTTLLEMVKNTFEDNVVFLGTATFGGSSYITFASNLDIKWNDYIKETIDTDLITGIYPNDNMGYYKHVLYPDFLRY
mgnify:CR=1 FL=1